MKITDFIDEVRDLYLRDLKEQIRQASIYGAKSIDYVTELDSSEIEVALGKGFKVNYMTYDTVTISWIFERKEDDD